MIKKIIFVGLLAVFLLGIMPAGAQVAQGEIEAEVIGINVEGNEIETIVKIHRGIDMAARTGRAPFRLLVSLIWPEITSPVLIDVPIGETTLIDVGPCNAVISVSILVDRPPASASDVTATAKIVTGKPDFVIKSLKDGSHCQAS